MTQKNQFAAPIGTVISDEETPSFERVRVNMEPGRDLKPGALIGLAASDRQDGGTLIGRVSGAHEWNPNETVDNAKVRSTLQIQPNYPGEADSTTIYRVAEAELIEEIVQGVAGPETRAPETLPKSGAGVYFADQGEIALSLGLSKDGPEKSIFLGHTVGGVQTPIYLKRDAIQRHFFIGGTTGSGKSYAMGVLAEELVRQGLPVIFIDTQDEYFALAKALDGKAVTPGDDFTIPPSSLTESEMLGILPGAMKQSPLQCDIVGKAHGNLSGPASFSLQDLIDEAKRVTPDLCARESDVARTQDTVERRLKTLKHHEIFGEGPRDWRAEIMPCLAIRCKRLPTVQLQTVATAVLRDLQNRRLNDEIPPYVAVVDEAHLFVPEGEGSPCKQIIREGVRIGRHHGICMVLMTQSPVDIDKRAIRQCNTRMVFALEPDQLRAIEGVKADASEAMLRALPKMPRGTCVLSGTYESVKHAVTVRVRPREKTKNAEGGKAPDIFEMVKDKKWEKPARKTGAPQNPLEGL